MMSDVPTSDEPPLDPERAAVLKRVLAILEADRGGFDPPPGLAAATIALAAGRRPVPAGDWRAWRPWVPSFETAVVAGIALLVVGLSVAAVGKVRDESRVLACQNRLRELHAALDGYADTHTQRFPQAGTREVPAAGDFLAELARAGQVPPAGGETYAYTLGYRTGGGVVGLRRGDVPGLAPIAADLPSGPRHGHGQNVLFVNGSARFATTPALGVGGDDIYHNQAGEHRAGLHRDDASLGGPADVP